MPRIALVGLLAAVLCVAGLSSPGSACAKSVISFKDIADNSPAFAFLADRTTSSVHRLNLLDYTDTIIATGLRAVRGISLSNRALFVFNDDEQLYRLAFDQNWNIVASQLLGTLAVAGDCAGNAIYVEGQNLYTAGPCGIAHFGLSADPPFLRFKEIVTQVNVVSFTTNPAGMLFLLDTDTGVLYQVGITAGRRDWTTLRPYKKLRLDRASSVAADSQGDLLVAVSNYRLVSAPRLCGVSTPNEGPATSLRNIPEGVSFIVRLDADTRQESIFWYGLPLDLDPPTEGIVGLDATSQVVAVISKRPFTDDGSNLLLFSGDGQFLTFQGFPDDELVSLAVTPGDIVTAPDFSISCTPTKNAIAAGQSAQYTLNINPVGGWNNAVALSIEGLPAGAKAQFSPQTIPDRGSDRGSASTLTISTTEASHKGKYTLTITAMVITRNPTVTSHRRTKCKLRVL
jgi:hypothetical protein